MNLERETMLQISQFKTKPGIFSILGYNLCNPCQLSFKLKKGIFTVLIGFISVTGVMAQYADSARYDYVRPENGQSTANHKNYISFGFGFGGYYPYSGIFYSESPGLSLSFENTTFKHAGPGNITLGAMFSYKQISSTYTDYSSTYTYQQVWNYYMLGARITYHLTEPLIWNIEPYVGGMAGYYFTRFNFSSTDPNSNEPGDPGYYLTPNVYPNFVACSIFAGVRSYISSRSVAWLEFGYGYTTLAIGASYKL